MPVPRSSARSASDSPVTPYLVAQYVAAPPSGLTPATEDRLTMWPLPTSCAAAPAASASRSPIATLAPSRARAAAVALPMPRAPPVTTATFPASERGCLAMRCGSSCDEPSARGTVSEARYLLRLRALEDAGALAVGAGVTVGTTVTVGAGVGTAVGVGFGSRS